MPAAKICRRIAKARGLFAPVEPRAHHAYGDPARGGFAILYVGVILLAAFALVSLAVDMGRLRVARLQLSTAADAAAIAGVRQLPVVKHIEATTEAVVVASENTAIQGTGNAVTVTLQAASDVEIGLYRFSTEKFTKVGSTEPNGHTVRDSDANAMHVTAWRSDARGTAVGLFFARAIGLNQMDVRGEATAVVRGGGSGFGIVGIDWVQMNGNTKTDSYNAAAGPYDKNNPNHNGTVASNGSISMVGTSDIWGDARPGVDASVSTTGQATVHGWTAPLEEPLNYPPKPIPAGAISVTWPGSGKLSLPRAGDPVSNDPDNPTNYVLNKIKMKGGDELNISGYVAIYVTGDIDIGGGSVANSPPPQLPARLLLVKVGSGDVDLGGNGQLFAHVYAPQADVRLHGTGQDFALCGWVIGKTLDVKGNSAIHYDESLPSPSGPRRASLVK